MMEKGKQKSKYRIVDMAMVAKMLCWREKRNETLQGTKLSCTLHPRNAEPCYSCAHRAECKHYEWERDFIHKNEEAAQDSRMRNQRYERQLERQNTMASHESDADTVQDENEPVSISLNGEETVYPCNEFYFTCPDQNRCDKGINCLWKP